MKTTPREGKTSRGEYAFKKNKRKKENEKG